MDILKAVRRKEWIATEPLIRLEHVKKTYGQGEHSICALRDLSLTVEKGEYAAILGRSGSGKSTLMNLLGCLDFPDEGQYLLDGSPITRLQPDALTAIRREHIGFVFQHFHLIPSLTALENVELPLLYRRFSRKERRQRALSALELVGLSHRASHRPGQLSGGQQQRTAIARAIAADPPLILADEPTGNLDRENTALVTDLLTGLWKKGHTLILITHDPTVAQQAPRRLTLQDGQIVSDTQHPL